MRMRLKDKSVVITGAGTEGVIQSLTDYTVEDFSYTLEVNVNRSMVADEACNSNYD